MEIKKLYPADADKRTTYKLTKGQGAVKMSAAAGCTISPKCWCMYTDTDNKGNPMDVITIMDGEGTVFATNSPTFARDFNDIVEVFGDELPELLILTGESKSGRTFVTVTVA